LTNKGIIEISRAMKQLFKLKEFYIYDNTIEAEGMRNLLSAVKKCEIVGFSSLIFDYRLLQS